MNNENVQRNRLIKNSYEDLAKRSMSQATTKYTPMSNQRSTSFKFTTQPQETTELRIPDFRCKLVCVGDGGAGKTSLLRRFIYNDFPEQYQPTVFEDYSVTIERNHKMMELALWDTAGQEEYDRLRSLSYPETDIALLCFSIADPASLTNIKEKWLPEIKLYCPGVPYLVIGLKCDLQERGEGCETPNAAALAKEWGAAGYIECSARNGHDVPFVFDSVVKVLMKSRDSSWRRLFSSQQSSLSRTNLSQQPQPQPQTQQKHSQTTNTKHKPRRNSEGKPRSRKCIIS